MKEIKSEKMRITIIDYGMGNLRSVYNKFKKLDIDVVVSSKIYDIENADKIVLPGVGHFKNGMENLEKNGFIEILNKKVLIERIPILGICLGTQLFAKFSEEGYVKGLGWIDADVVRFNINEKLFFKVPHMGWNNVRIINPNYLNSNINNNDQFYFVHSYHLQCYNEEDVWLKTKYEYEFVSAIKKGNIYGTQFHPEKSHDVGFELIKKFAEI